MYLGLSTAEPVWPVRTTNRPIGRFRNRDRPRDGFISIILQSDNVSGPRAMYAIDDLGDAIDVTRGFLTPVDPRMWLKLAFVVFFISALGFSGPPTTPTGDTTVEDEPFAGTELEGTLPDLTGEELLTIVLVVVALALALWLFFAVVGAIMEFVFLESLRSHEVHVRRYGMANLGRAGHLFLFRGLLGLLGFALVGIPALSIVTSASTVDEIAVGSLVLLAFAGFGYFLLYALVMRLTTEFVAPIMLLEERGILSAWKRFWSTLAGSWTEYLVYVVVVVIAQVVLGIAVGFLSVVAALVVGIPTAIVAVALAVFGGTVGLYLAVGVGLLGLAAFVLVLALVQVPVVSYFRYYALLLLGDTNAELDLIPDQRAAVRSGGGGGSAGVGPGPATDTRNSWDDSDAGWGNSRGSGSERAPDHESDWDSDSDGRNDSDGGDGNRDDWR